MVICFAYEELGRLVLGGGRGHDEEEEAWFGPAESKTEEDDADREPTTFYILCFSPGSDLSALFVGAGRGGKERGLVSESPPRPCWPAWTEQGRVTCPPRATCSAGSRAGEARLHGLRAAHLLLEKKSRRGTTASCMATWTRQLIIIPKLCPPEQEE